MNKNDLQQEVSHDHREYGEYCYPMLRSSCMDIIKFANIGYASPLVFIYRDMLDNSRNQETGKDPTLKIKTIIEEGQKSHYPTFSSPDSTLETDPPLLINTKSFVVGYHEHEPPTEQPSSKGRYSQAHRPGPPPPPVVSKANKRSLRLTDPIYIHASCSTIAAYSVTLEGIADDAGNVPRERHLPSSQWTMLSGA